MIDIDFGRLSRMASRPVADMWMSRRYALLCAVVIVLGAIVVFVWEYAAFSIGYWRRAFEVAWLAPLAYSLLVFWVFTAPDWPRFSRSMLIASCPIYAVAAWAFYSDAFLNSVVLLVSVHMYLASVTVLAAWQLFATAESSSKAIDGDA